MSSVLFQSVHPSPAVVALLITEYGRQHFSRCVTPVNVLFPCLQNSFQIGDQRSLCALSVCSSSVFRIFYLAETVDQFSLRFDLLLLGGDGAMYIFLI